MKNKITEQCKKWVARNGAAALVFLFVLAISLIRVAPEVAESITVDRSLTYSGPIVDLVDDMNHDEDIHIVKTDMETGEPITLSYKVGKTVMSYPRMKMDDITYRLRFEGDRLTGYMPLGDDLSMEYKTDAPTMRVLLMDYQSQVRGGE